MIFEIQKHTHWTLEQIGELNEDQALFFFTGGKSIPPPKQDQPFRPVVSYKWDKSLTPEENREKFKQMREEWLKTNGKNS